MRAGHFPPGNMGPKIESVLRFLHSGGKEAIITSYEYLARRVSGTAGTHVVPTQTAGSRYGISGVSKFR